MKAQISKIENGLVFAKTVNPMGEKSPKKRHFLGTGMFEKKSGEWQQAESERKELPLHPDSFEQIQIGLYPEFIFMNTNLSVKIDDEIEVIEQDNKFKIV